MSIAPGSLGFEQLTTDPQAPPPGFCIIYSKTDNVVYLRDSSGTIVPLGSASSITSLTGEATGSGPGAAVVTLSNSAVIGKVLTGFIAGPNSTVLSTDTILQAIQKLQAQVSATIGSAITGLTGDISASGPGNVSATVNTVGGKTASDIAAATATVDAATSTNTASTLVERDASGNFSANVITATLSGNATTATNATSFTGPLSGDVTGHQSTTVVSTVGGKTASDIAGAVTQVDNATSTNTASTIVERDASGNFAAATITAALTGNVTGNVSGSSSTFTSPLVGDVTGNQTTTVVQAIQGTSVSNSAPTDTQILIFNSSASKWVPQTLSGDLSMNHSGAVTIPATVVTGKVLTGFVTGSNTPIAATDTVLQALEKTQGQINATTGAAITALTGDVTATGPGSVSGTVNSVGGSSAANIHSAELAANAATDANTPSTIVKRDPSGNFSASTVTANLTGNVTGNVSGSSASFTGSLAGDVSGTQSATSVDKIKGVAVDSTAPTDAQLLVYNTSTSKWVPQSLSADLTITNAGVTTIQANVVSNSKLAQMPTNTIKGNNTGSTANASDLTVAQTTAMLNNSTPPVQIGTTNAIGSSNFVPRADHVHAHGSQTDPTLHALATPSANGFMSSTDKALINTATASNTPSSLVERDASGNFSAGTITASLSGNATTATSAASATNFTGSLSGDVTGTQSATVVSTVGGSTATNVHSAELAANAATNLNTPSTIVKRDSSGQFHVSAVQLDGSISGTVSLNAAASTTSYPITLPPTQGAAGTFPSNDGAGNLTWTNPLVNIDGGAPNSNYVASQVINGGTP